MEVSIGKTWEKHGKYREIAITEAP